MSYSDISWLPLTAGLTILGLVLSYLAYRRRGLRPALMGTAFSLLPIAAYLTGATEMLWKIGAAIGQFGTGFVFSPEQVGGHRRHRPRDRAVPRGRRAAAAPGRPRGAPGPPGRASEEPDAAAARPDRAGLGAPDRTRALAHRETGQDAGPG